MQIYYFKINITCVPCPTWCKPMIDVQINSKENDIICRPIPECSWSYSESQFPVAVPHMSGIGNLVQNEIPIPCWNLFQKSGLLLVQSLVIETDDSNRPKLGTHPPNTGIKFHIKICESTRMMMPQVPPNWWMRCGPIIHPLFDPGFWFNFY
jgi:hypothetical protein